MKISASKLFPKLHRITTNQLYFPEIDGIRFLAIFLVFLTHVSGYLVNKSEVPVIGNPVNNFWMRDLLFSKRGVQLFFVLSGFILCLPFAHHYINKGKKVNLKKYYLRRVTRLEPPYFIAMTALFFLAIVMKLYSFSFLFPSLLASMVYMHNIIFQHAPYISVVAWSLEIEIQFYLMAPLLFRVLMLPKLIRRSLLTITALLFVGLQQNYIPAADFIYNHIQFFLAGILLADIYVSGSHKALNTVWGNLAAVILFFAVLFIPIEKSYHAMLVFPFSIAAFYLFVLSNGMAKKIFSYKFIPIIGGMCYSIYLLHYPLVAFFGKYTTLLRVTDYYLPNLLIQLVLLAIPVLAICGTFYYFIERPFMSSKWMDKLMKNKKNDEANPIPEPAVTLHETP